MTISNIAASWYEEDREPIVDNLIPRGPDFDCFIRTWDEASASIDYCSKLSPGASANLGKLSGISYLTGDEKVLAILGQQPHLGYALNSTKRIVITYKTEGHGTLHMHGTGVFVTYRHLFTCQHILDPHLELGDIKVYLGDIDEDGQEIFILAKQMNIPEDIQALFDPSCSTVSEIEGDWRKDEGDLDFVVLVTERPINDIEPLRINQNSVLYSKDPVVSIGFPSFDAKFDYSECVSGRFLRKARHELTSCEQFLHKFVEASLFHWEHPLVSFGLAASDPSESYYRHSTCSTTGGMSGGPVISPDSPTGWL